MKKYKSEFIGHTYFSDDFKLYINRWQEGFENPQHFHNFIEITIIEEGRGFHHINDDIIPVKKGELFLIPIGISHVFRPISVNSKTKLTVYNVLFDPQIMKKLIKETRALGETSISDWFNELGTSTNFDYLHLKDKSDICLSLIRSMYMEYQQQQSGYSIVVQSNLHELLTHLFRLKHRSVVNSKSKISPYDIKETTSYITEHFCEPLTLSHMAKNMLVSERHFSRMFKKYTGQTFTEYLQNQRIEKSCQLLRSTEYSIKEISHLVGYNDIDYFRSIFSKKLGLTPHEYRKQDEK